MSQSERELTPNTFKQNNNLFNVLSVYLDHMTDGEQGIVMELRTESNMKDNNVQLCDANSNA